MSGAGKSIDADPYGMWRLQKECEADPFSVDRRQQEFRHEEFFELKQEAVFYRWIAVALSPIVSRLFEPVEVAVVVLYGGKAGLAIDAALDDVQRRFGELDPGATGHVSGLKSQLMLTPLGRPYRWIAVALSPIVSRLFEPVEVAVVVLYGEKAGLAIDAALDDVQRRFGEVDAGATWHVRGWKVN